ncbi:hypothetical protein C8J56DRAFT_891285 [Mycena floridula]|nr:hypothetical protein C8J56DRAFT_891285 [Mycena floridula]
MGDAVGSIPDKTQRMHGTPAARSFKLWGSNLTLSLPGLQTPILGDLMPTARSTTFKEGRKEKMNSFREQSTRIQAAQCRVVNMQFAPQEADRARSIEMYLGDSAEMKGHTGFLTNQTTSNSLPCRARVAASTIENFAVSTVFMWMPWVTELILLLRVVVMFRTTDRRILSMASLLALPISLKVTRAVINIFVLMNWWNETSEFLANGVERYVSFPFLWHLNGQGHLFDGVKIGRIDARRSITSKMKALFWIACTNFFFPREFPVCMVTGQNQDLPIPPQAVFLTCQIVLAFSGKGLVLASVNVIYVSIVSTVLATVWSSTTWYEQKDTAITLEKHYPALRRKIPVFFGQVGAFLALFSGNFRQILIQKGDNFQDRGYLQKVNFKVRGQIYGQLQANVG